MKKHIVSKFDEFYLLYAKQRKDKTALHGDLVNTHKHGEILV